MGKTKHPRIIFSIEPKRIGKKKYRSASKYRRKMLNALNLAKQQKINVVSDHKSSKLDFKEYAVSVLGKDKVVWLDYTSDGKSTIEMMDNGAHVIFNPRLINRSEGISDTGDVLVRTDTIGLLLPSYEYQDDYTQSKFGWRYLLIGFHTERMNLYNNSDRIYNTDSIKYQKSRLFLQNRILDYYQHARNDFALIIGPKEEPDTSLDPYQYGEVNFDTWDGFTCSVYNSLR